MIYEPRRPLNLGRFRKDDVVRHYRNEAIYRVLRLRWRSETLDCLNLETGEEEIFHPRFLDEVTEPLVVLAANAA